MKKQIVQIVLPVCCFACMALESSCVGDYGANPYDPNTPVTVSQWPKVISFVPESGEAGDVVTITGVNFSTAKKVTFGGRDAESFEIVDDGTITAVLSPYGNSGAVAVTNHKGERSMQGFTYLWPVEPSENPNLALNCTASASEAFTGFLASSVNDGNPSSAWVANGNDIEHWVEIDLGKVTAINSVVLTWDPNAAGTDYKLQVSEDGSSYNTIAEETGWDASADGGIKKMKFDEVNARYVKLAELHNSKTGYNMTLWEFEIYNTPPPVNVALKKVVTGSSNENAVFQITYGDPAFWWQIDKADEAPWAIVDLGLPTVIDNVKIWWDNGAYPKNVTVSVSSDNETYSPVYEVEGWTVPEDMVVKVNDVLTAAIMDIFFDEVEPRYIKVDFNTSSSPYAMGMCELEVYNQW